MGFETTRMAGDSEETLFKREREREKKRPTAVTREREREREKREERREKLVLDRRKHFGKRAFALIWRGPHSLEAFVCSFTGGFFR